MNKKKIFKFIFYILFFSFLIVYLSELTGYYEYQNYQKKTLTEEQITKFEQDIKDGKEIDINNYITVENVAYNNKLSTLASKMSNGISKIVEGGVDQTFRILFKLIDE